MIVFTSWMRQTLLLVLLLAQISPTLELERWSMFDGSHFALMVFIAQHADGSPARGTIRCAGGWYKHQDERKDKVLIESYPFATDSRGAVGFNPVLDDDDVMDCTAEDIHHHIGRITSPILPLANLIITVR